MVKPDWEAIESAYHAGDLPIREIARQFGISDTAIRNRATKCGWKRVGSLRSEVRSANQQTCAKALADNDDLTEQQKLFVTEYIMDFNATQAAIRAGYSENSASTIGHQLLQKTKVAQEIANQKLNLLSANLMTAEDILKRWIDQATADANDLVEYRRSCCRYCYGVDHQYQWTPAEYERAKKEAVIKEKPEPENEGGFGYNPTLPPVPDCPECCGEGVGRIHVKDTRYLPHQARLLYRGVHQGKDGLKIIMADQDKALEFLAKHFGVLNEKIQLTGKDGGPIQTTQTQLTPEQLREVLKGIIDEV
jgi:predicted DNA-binding protein YlxM (UPF0122 family)